MDDYDHHDFDQIRQKNLYLHQGYYQTLINNLFEYFPRVNSIYGIICLSIFVFMSIQTIYIINNIVFPSVEDQMKEEENKLNKRIDENRKLKDLQANKYLKLLQTKDLTLETIEEAIKED